MLNINYICYGLINWTEIAYTLITDNNKQILIENNDQENMIYDFRPHNINIEIVIHYNNTKITIQKNYEVQKIYNIQEYIKNVTDF